LGLNQIQLSMVYSLFGLFRRFRRHYVSYGMGPLAHGQRRRIAWSAYWTEPRVWTLVACSHSRIRHGQDPDRMLEELRYGEPS